MGTQPKQAGSRVPVSSQIVPSPLLRTRGRGPMEFSLWKDPQYGRRVGGES